MGWPTITLNDGHRLPSIAYGHIYWTDNDRIEPDVLSALEAGFIHLDTAQGYYDEDKFGSAIRRSGIKREDLYITTKWSRADTDIRASCENSLKQIGVKQVDLYMPHSAALMGADEATQRARWAQFELVKKLGYTRSLGVSNFDIHQLKSLMASCTVPPTVNQIQFDPHSYAEMLPLVEYCKKHQILIEAYSPLIPLRDDPNGPVGRATGHIAKRIGAAPEQVLMAWCKAKGVAVVTSSSRKERMGAYLRAGDIDLTSDDIARIDAAGVESTLLKKAAGGKQRRPHALSVAVGSVYRLWPGVLLVLGLVGLWRLLALWVRGM